MAPGTQAMQTCCSPFPLRVPHYFHLILVSIPRHIEPYVGFALIRLSDDLLPEACTVPVPSSVSSISRSPYAGGFFTAAFQVLYRFPGNGQTSLESLDTVASTLQA